MTYDRGEVTYANDDWRWDQERRDEWRNFLQLQKEHAEEAMIHLERAYEAMRSAPHAYSSPHGQQAIFERMREAVSHAHMVCHRDIEHVTKEPTDTAIGNYAAFGHPRG